MSRSQLRDGITSRIEAMSKTAADAASSNDAYRKYKSLLALVQEKSVIQQMIRAEIEVAEQMEAMRTKGGRRSTPIPKQL
jgi:5-formyltetrahydrofolate cyclo-ligase